MTPKLLDCEKEYVRKDLTGQRVGLLDVICPDDKTSTKYSHFFCLCDCGTIISLSYTSLINRYRKSCGCLRKHYLPESEPCGGECQAMICYADSERQASELNPLTDAQDECGEVWSAIEERWTHYYDTGWTGISDGKQLGNCLAVTHLGVHESDEPVEAQIIMLSYDPRNRKVPYQE